MLICREKAQKAQKATVGGHLIMAFARRWTQINADGEKMFLICVILRDLRAKSFQSLMGDHCGLRAPNGVVDSRHECDRDFGTNPPLAGK